MTRNDLYIAISGIEEDLLERSEMIQDNQTPTFRRVPFVLIAAIIAMLLMGAAGLVTIYRLVIGNSVVQTDNRFSIDFSSADAPAVMEDGRLWFIADGQRIDITDQIDKDTPYLYRIINPHTKRPAYIIVGGTPEDFGFAEIWENNGIIGFAAKQGDVSLGMKLTQEQFDQGLWTTVKDQLHGRWFFNAIKQLEPEL